LVGFSAAAPKRRSFISAEPFDDMLRTRRALGTLRAVCTHTENHM
jgi:hypothetical protein